MIQNTSSMDRAIVAPRATRTIVLLAVAGVALIVLAISRRMTPVA